MKPLTSVTIIASVIIVCITAIVISGGFDSDSSTSDISKIFQPKPSIIMSKNSGSTECQNQNSCFQPYDFKSWVGKKIVWENQDSSAHTVTAGTPQDGPSGQFNSELIMPGGQFATTIKKPGEYDYYCMVHPWARGKISVQ